MNYNALSIHEMLGHSSGWLHTPRIRNALSRDPLGRAMLDKLEPVHQTLAQRQSQRMTIEAAISELTASLSTHGKLFGDQVRAGYFTLTGLSHGAADPVRAERYRDLRDLLYPQGLSINNLSYMAQTGVAVETRNRVTPEVRAELARIPFDDRTLADVYDQWMQTADVMGQQAQERAQLSAAASRDGTASEEVDMQGPRRQWIRGASMLVDGLDMMDIPDEVREAIVAPLERSIRNATRPGQDTAAEPDEVSGDVPAPVLGAEPVAAPAIEVPAGAPV